MIEKVTPVESDVRKSTPSFLSWGAVVGGGILTAALSFVLFFLGDEPQR